MPNSKSCTHIKVTGARCESPALRGEQFCYFHQHAHRGVRRPSRSRLHPIALIESEEAIQASLMEVINGLLRNPVREIPEYAEPASGALASLAGRAKAPVPTRSVPDIETEASLPEPELDMPYTAAIPLQPTREERAEREHQAKVELERARRATIRAQLERAGRTVANGDFSPISQRPAVPSAAVPHPSGGSKGGSRTVDPTERKPPVSVKAETKNTAAPKKRKNAAQRASAG